MKVLIILRFGDDGGGTITIFLGVMFGSDENDAREMEVLRSLALAVIGARQMVLISS